MTANRCIRCEGRLIPEDVDKHLPKHLQQPKTYRCKKCGRRFIKVKRSWVPV